MKQVSESLKVALIFIIVLLLSVLFLKSVKAHSSLSGSDNLRCMTEALYHEARGEPVNGVIAVKKVILNRVADRRWPDNVCDVVYQPSQFSYTNGLIPPVVELEEYRKSERIARLQHSDNFYGATHYFNYKLVNPSWARNLTFIKRIGNHSFYK